MDIKEEMLLHKWAKDLADQSSSGLTQEQWCKLNGVNINTFRYRNRRVCNAVELKHQENSKEIVPFENKMPEPTFAKVTLKAPDYTSRDTDSHLIRYNSRTDSYRVGGAG